MGFLAKTITLLTITLKWLHLTPPNLVGFCFYLLDTSWQNFSKIDTPGWGGGGVAAVVFERRCLEKFSIYTNFLFCFKTMEMHTWGYKFVCVCVCGGGGGGLLQFFLKGDVSKNLAYIQIFCFVSKLWKCIPGGINLCQERCFQA